MRFLPELFENNRTWANRHLARDPEFFARLCAIQNPAHLWIGCSDSRVPANEIVGLAPGELFVHRNVGNVVRADDRNCMAVLQYAVEQLRIAHIMVTGHYGCGGVQAAFAPPAHGPLGEWVDHIRAVRIAHAMELDPLPDDLTRSHRLCELNVMDQVVTLSRLPVITEAWRRGQPITLHGWIYDLRDGLIRDLGVSLDGPASDGSG